MGIEIKVFSDYVCPFCYLGKAIVDLLSKEYTLCVTWLGFELHPSTPPLGTPLAERFAPEQLDRLFSTLRARAEEMGVPLAKPEILPNSRLALEAAEYARDRGCFEQFHEAIFRAYFVEGKNIGRFHVIAEAAAYSGLDPQAVKSVLESGLYSSRLASAREEAKAWGVKGIPFFVIEDQTTIEGARSLDEFRAAIQAVLKQDRGSPQA